MAKVGFAEERNEWLAVVFRQKGDCVEVLTVGCEDSEEAAHEWARGTMNLMDEHDDDELELPDKYDRQRMA